jgi:phage gp36-like protein
MAGYTLNDSWCSVQDVRNQNPLFTAAVVEDDKVNEFIDDAVELIKGKLRLRYDLNKFVVPLPADLKKIRLLCARLACYKMASTRPDVVANPEMAIFLWNLAIKELNEIAEGMQSLPASYLLSSGSATQPGTIRGALTPIKRKTSLYDQLRD